MSNQRARLIEHFRGQARNCGDFGAPFTQALIDHMADDLASDGVLSDLVGDWPGNPHADAVSLRLAGALHAAAQTGRDPELTAAWPSANGPSAAPADPARAWPIARAFLAREKDWVRAFAQNPPQTNETRRSAALLGAFLTLARDHPGLELTMLELGASAGLNLNWDKFSYRFGDWTWGPKSSVCIETDWSGPRPAQTRPRVRTRAGCDQNPLDLKDPDARLRLRAYIWAEQTERLARFDAAAELAIAERVHVDRADAADWIMRALASRPASGLTIVYHSVFFQYPPPATQAAIAAAIEAAGAEASPSAPLAWVRFEPERLFANPNGPHFAMALDMVTWPGGVHRVLATVDPHGRFVNWRSDDASGPA